MCVTVTAYQIMIVVCDRATNYDSWVWPCQCNKPWQYCRQHQRRCVPERPQDSPRCPGGEPVSVNRSCCPYSTPETHRYTSINNNTPGTKTCLQISNSLQTVETTPQATRQRCGCISIYMFHFSRQNFFKNKSRISRI